MNELRKTFLCSPTQLRLKTVLKSQHSTTLLDDNYTIENGFPFDTDCITSEIHNRKSTLKTYYVPKPWCFEGVENPDASLGFFYWLFVTLYVVVVWSHFWLFLLDKKESDIYFSRTYHYWNFNYNCFMIQFTDEKGTCWDLLRFFDLLKFWVVHDTVSFKVHWNFNYNHTNFQLVYILH